MRTLPDGGCGNAGRRLRDRGGQITGWFGTATDIEELKQAEEAQRESAVLRQLATAQDEERLRIARYLHDQLGRSSASVRARAGCRGRLRWRSSG